MRTPGFRLGEGLDVALAIGIGVIGALLVLNVPVFVAAVLVGGLFSLAMFTRFDRVEDVAAVFFLLTAFTIPMNRLFVGASGLPASDVMLVLALGLYLLVRLKGHEAPAGDRTYRTVVLGLAILGVGGFVGALFESPGPFIYKALGVDARDVSGWGQNIGNLGKFLLGSLVPMALFALARPDRRFLRRIATCFAGGCVASSLVGALLPYGSGGNRVIGMTVHPNQYGSLSLLAMGPILGLMLTSRRVRWWGFASLPLLGYAILGSGSRATLGGLVILGLIVGPLTRSRVVMGAILTGAALALILFVTGIVKPEGENALGRALGNSSTAQGSDTIRDDLHTEVWQRFIQRPITGNGYNYMRPSHNVYLGIIASAGVLGVIGFGIVLTSVVRRMWRLRGDLLVVGITASYIAYLCNAYFDNIFWWRWLWFYVGMVVAVSTTRPGPDEVRSASAGTSVRGSRPPDPRASVRRADVEIGPALTPSG